MNVPLELIQAIKTTQHIAVLTGAGISAESGVPTFREAQSGLWAKYNPEELATPQAFSENPALVWRWYRWRQEIISQADPNPGHLALAQMESIITRNAAHFTIITQNVDGLHQRAGSQNIIELHGNINRNKCFNCDAIVKDGSSNSDELPRCLQCGGLLRPDVVWFGENLPSYALQIARNASQECDIFFSIGTSAFVQPAASLPIIALQNGAVIVEINPNNTSITLFATHIFHGPSGEILPQLVKQAWPESG